MYVWVISYVCDCICLRFFQILLPDVDRVDVEITVDVQMSDRVRINAVAERGEKLAIVIHLQAPY